MSIELENPAPLLVLVTVGSEHHPFDRMVAWVDAWLRDQHGNSDIRCVVQYGTSTPPVLAEGYDFVDHHKLQELMAEAAVIVTQGGPMSILEARGAGKVPIVIPRDPQLGEHVDGHQKVFARRMADEQLARVPASAAEFAAMLDEAIDRPDAFVAARDELATDRVEATVARFGALVNHLVTAPVDHRPRLLLVMGPTGADQVARAVAAAPGAAAPGGAVHPLNHDAVCGCGSTAASCEFWSAVGQRAFGGWDTSDAEDFVGLRPAVVRNRRIPALLGFSLTVGWRLRRDRLARLLRAFYESADATNDSLLVESSAAPAHVALLTRAGLRLQCVLVVGRGPAGSRTAAQTLLWQAFAYSLRWLGGGEVTVCRVRYSDFAADPDGCAARIVQTTLSPRRSGDLSPSG